MATLAELQAADTKYVLDQKKPGGGLKTSVGNSAKVPMKAPTAYGFYPMSLETFKLWVANNPPPVGTSATSWLHTQTGWTDDPAAVAAAQAAAAKIEKKNNTGIAGGIAKASQVADKIEAKIQAAPIVQKASTVVDKVSEKINDGTVKILAAAAKILPDGDELKLAPLLPFKQMMVNALDRKKVAHGSSLTDIAPKFASYIVQGNNFESSEQNMYVNGFNFSSTKQSPQLNYRPYQHNVVLATIATVTAVTALVKQIIDFIKGMKAKKDKGEQLTKEEQSQLKDAETGATTLMDSAGISGLTSDVIDFVNAVKKDPSVIFKSVATVSDGSGGTKVIEPQKIMDDNTTIGDSVKNSMASTNIWVIIGILLVLYLVVRR